MTPASSAPRRAPLLALLAAAAALLAPLARPLAAQQPDTVPPRDSNARRDSIIRHDSLLFERAKRRIEGEAVTQVPPRELDAPIRQGLRAPRLRASVGATMATPFAEDRSGVEVSMQPGALVGLGVAWDAMMHTTFTFGLRGTRSPVRFEEDGETWSGDPVLLLDAAAGVERAFGSRLALRAGAVGAWIDGPENVVPFSVGGGSRFHLGGELGAAVWLMSSRPLALAFTAQPVRLSGSSIVQPGTVTRFILELRYGR